MNVFTAVAERSFGSATMISRISDTTDQVLFTFYTVKLAARRSSMTFLIGMGKRWSDFEGVRREKWTKISLLRRGRNDRQGRDEENHTLIRVFHDTEGSRESTGKPTPHGLRGSDRNGIQEFLQDRWR